MLNDFVIDIIPKPVGLGNANPFGAPFSRLYQVIFKGSSRLRQAPKDDPQ
jgi:hypothetical protein